ncbi:MAG: cohesin domain-containing protein [Acutalibacteraceae bacterium]
MRNRIYRMTKRLGACAIAFCLMVMMCMPAAAHTNPVTFSLTTTNGEVGDTITVSLNISPESYFTNATFYLYYDNDAVEYVSDDLGSASPRGAMYMSNNFVDRGFLKAVYVTVSGIKNGGQLVEFTFKVLKKTAAAFSLKMDECNGVEADDTTEFDLVYILEGCIANDDGSLERPSTVTSPATVTPPATTAPLHPSATTAAPSQGNATTPTNSNSEGTQAAPATSIVTVPVTVTEANGAPVTNAQGIVQTTFITSSITVTTSQNQSTATGNIQTQGTNRNIILWVCLALLVVAVAVAILLLLVARRKKQVENQEEQPNTSFVPESKAQQTISKDTAADGLSQDETVVLTKEKEEPLSAPDDGSADLSETETDASSKNDSSSEE